MNPLFMQQWHWHLLAWPKVGEPGYPTLLEFDIFLMGGEL